MTTREVRLTLPYARPPEALWGNARPHWSARARATRQVRQDVLTLGRAAGLHRLAVPPLHVTVRFTWAPGDRIRRDEDNCWPMIKACCDGLARGRADLIGLDLVPDDHPAFMTKERPLILPPPAKGMWLDLTLNFGEEAVA